MTRMEDLPVDILLCIMRHLEVADILRAERTCRIIRNVITNRHLWLTKLRELDQVCAPNLPPYIDPKTLAYSDVRDVVVKAERSYFLITNGSSTRLQYECMRRVSLERPIELRYERRQRINSAKVTPDGRYLFMVYVPSAELRLFDLKDQGRKVWTSNVTTIRDDPRVTFCMITYAFEQHAEHCMTVALLIPETSTDNGYLQVLRLELPSAPNNSCKETAILTAKLDSRPVGDPTISANLVASVTTDYSVIVWNCKSRQSTKFRIPGVLLLGLPVEIQIWDEHLFCKVYSTNDGIGLWAFSLDGVLSSPSPAHKVVLDSSDISVLYVPFGNVHYSIYRDRWRHDEHNTVVTLVGAVHDLPPKIVSVRTIFNRRMQPDKKWTRIDVQFTRALWDDTGETRETERHFPSVLSPPSRSGRFRVLIARLGTTPYPEWGFASLTKSGGAVLRRLSESVWSRKDPETRRLEYPPDCLTLYTEPYSGTVVKIRNSGPVTEIIELYRLAQ